MSAAGPPQGARPPSGERREATQGGQHTSDRCEHFGEAIDVPPRANGCEACMALGATWTELRVCQTCGHVGCCEDSKHAHARHHFQTTGHPMIMPFDRKETWAWCYVHDRYFHGVRDATRTPGGGLRKLFRRLTGR